MNRLAIALACCLAAFACERKPAPPVDAPTDSPFENEPMTRENDNLLNLAFGATVLDRDNELNYETSAAHAIDGMEWTPWSAAPGGKLRGIFALAAPTRLAKLGVFLPIAASHPPATLRIEASLDGRSWSPILEKTIEPNTTRRRLFDVEPVIARYLRVSIETTGSSAAIRSLFAIGAETEPYAQPPLEGCWEINHEPARFIRNGPRVAGTIGGMLIDGDTDGRVYRLMWLEQAMWGYAGVAVSPDGNRLSGVRWHEEVNPKNNGDGWIGHRVPCGAAELIDSAKIAQSVLQTATLWRMDPKHAEALDLAARLIREHPQRRFRVVAREFRAPSEAENRRRAAAKLDVMRDALRARGVDVARLEFVNAGTERSELAVDSTTQRVMDSMVELQLVPAR